MRLCELSPGESGVVLRTEAEGPFGERLREMGLTPGGRVRAVRRMPAGDPTEYALRGAHVAIRARDAARVFVKREEGVCEP